MIDPAQPTWRETEREYTTLFETELEGFEVWLEWNDRVSAYRFGFLPPANLRGERIPSESSLGFANDAEAAKCLLLERLAGVKLQP